MVGAGSEIGKMRVIGNMHNSVRNGEESKNQESENQAEEKNSSDKCSMDSTTARVDVDQIDQSTLIDVLNCRSKKILALDNEDEGDKQAQQTKQLALYKGELLPIIRKTLEKAGSLDGASRLGELAKSNSMINGALGIEGMAFAISSGIAHTNALILQAKNTLGVKSDLIKELETRNRKLIADLVELSGSPTGGGSMEMAARDSVTYWSNLFGNKQALAIAQAGPAQKILKGANVGTTIGTNYKPENAGVKPGPGATQISELDDFLERIRRIYQETPRMALDETRNRSNESARSNGRRPVTKKRVLDFEGIDSDRNSQPRSLQ